MNRISTLSTRDEVDLETRREDLRDRRWSRRRNMLLSGAVLLASLELGSDLPSHLADLLRWL